jgi:LysM repeat protein
MCGATLPAVAVVVETAPAPPSATLAPAEVSPAVAPPAAAPAPEVVESVMIERQSRLTLWMTLAMALIVVVAAAILFRFPPSAALALAPTPTPLPDAPEATAQNTLPPSATSPPTDTPTVTPTPRPTDTPQPPRNHVVVSGDTYFGLSLRYGVTVESILDANNLPPDAGLQIAQTLLIPWPTATPQLEPVQVTFGEEVVIADPRDCPFYTIQSGDTLIGIATANGLPLDALLAVNRLTTQSSLFPGDAICIPTIVRGGTLPPTAGPSPTASPTPPPPGPALLYPIDDAVIDPPGGPIVMQWVAVKDLAENEWYMVELTDLADVDSHAWRGFTRQNSFRVPSEWRPSVPEERVFRWRVRIVQVTGRRNDGSFTYTFGGRDSADAFFTWLGAVPTPTPLPTTTSTPEG